MTLKQAVKMARALRKRGYKVAVNVEVRTVARPGELRVVENYYVQ